MQLGKSEKGWTTRQFKKRTGNLLPELYRVARGLTNSDDEAQDLVHDSYVKAYQAAQKPGFKVPDTCRAWLFKIVLNTYRDRCRRLSRSPVVDPASNRSEKFDNVIELAVSQDPGPAERFDQKRFISAARNAILALDDEVRVVVTLFFLEELSYRAISKLADIPLGTVMSRLSRGRKILRRELRHFVDGSLDEQRVNTAQIVQHPKSKSKSKSKRD